MKSPWQIGFLAIALAGVSAYDVVFFGNRKSNAQSLPQTIEVSPASGVAAPALAPIIQPATPGALEGLAAGDAVPRISRDEIHSLSRQAFVAKEFAESASEGEWPRRDPFEARGELEPPAARVPAESVIHEISRPTPLSASVSASLPEPLPAPRCVFSGTLIELDRRLAFVDGVLRSVGDHLGEWQLSRIESDYIILESGKATHRIELNGTGSQVSGRSNPQ
jgi:hypothetical protein